MIDVTAFLRRRRAAQFAERPVDRHQVDKRVAGAQVIEAELRAMPLDGAAEERRVEREHLLSIDDAQHDVVDVVDRDHGVCSSCHVDDKPS